MSLLTWSDHQLHIGIPQLDSAHKAFVTGLHSLAEADRPEFSQLFADFVSHLEQHFADELQLMRDSGFSATSEHHGEHQRILGELAQLSSRVQDGKIVMARAYVLDRLPEWFRLHVTTMDSALAAHLQKH